MDHCITASLSSLSFCVFSFLRGGGTEKKILLCNTVWPPAGDPPAPASQGLELQDYATCPVSSCFTPLVVSTSSQVMKQACRGNPFSLCPYHSLPKYTQPPSVTVEGTMDVGGEWPVGPEGRSSTPLRMCPLQYMPQPCHICCVRGCAQC